MTSLCRGHLFPPDMISHAVQLYYRFTLRIRDIEDLLAEHCVTVSGNAVWLWCRTSCLPAAHSSSSTTLTPTGRVSIWGEPREHSRARTLPMEASTGSGANVPPSPGRPISRTPGKCGISDTPRTAGKSRPAVKSGKSTMTGCAEVPIRNLPVDGSMASARASSDAHAIARQARPARDPCEAGRGVGISDWRRGSLSTGNRW